MCTKMDNVLHNKRGVNTTGSCSVQFPVTSPVPGLMHHESPTSKGNSNEGYNAMVQVCSFCQSGSGWSYSRVSGEMDWLCQFQAITTVTLVHISLYPCLWQCDCAAPPTKRWHLFPYLLKVLHVSAHNPGILTVSHEQAWASLVEDKRCLVHWSYRSSG